MTSMNYPEQHYRVTAEIREFSNETVHLPGSEVMTKYSKRLLSKTCCIIPFSVKVFANGSSDSNKDYVCVIIDDFPVNKFYRIHCIISLIDSSDNQRFSQTFSISDDRTIEERGCIQYISREKLLSDPDEYLPKDVLKLLIDVHILEHNYFSKLTLPEEKCMSSFGSLNAYDNTSRTIDFDLDSPFGIRLGKESSVFRDILMVDESTNTVPINVGEYTSFKHIEEILMEEPLLRFESVKDIFDLYILADKYGIPSVIEFCKGFLKLCLFDHTLDEYIEIANGYEKEVLKELIVNLINRVKNVDMDEETIRKNGSLRLKQPIRRRVCFYRKAHFSLNFEILHESEIRQRNNLHDFYM